MTRGRYVLQIEDWGSWTNENTFVEPWRARQLARERYPHNNWRIWDTVRNQAISEAVTLTTELAGEQERFDNHGHVLERIRENNTRRERLGEIARRQRERSGLPRITAAEVFAPTPRRYEVDWWDDEDDEDWLVTAAPKVNWLKEGF